MIIIKKINPLNFLRVGMGLMYLYSGYDLIFNPQHWYGFVPSWFYKVIVQFLSVEGYLKIQGLGELVVGILFLCLFNKTWTVQITALLAVVEMVLILLFVGVDPITFRDIGLLGGALTLLTFSLQRGTK